MSNDMHNRVFDASDIRQKLLPQLEPAQPQESASRSDRRSWVGRQMAEWKERGYVPDSEDEDDESFPVQPPSRLLNNQSEDDGELLDVVIDSKDPSDKESVDSSRQKSRGIASSQVETGQLHGLEGSQGNVALLPNTPVAADLDDVLAELPVHADQDGPAKFGSRLGAGSSDDSPLSSLPSSPENSPLRGSQMPIPFGAGLHSSRIDSNSRQDTEAPMSTAVRGRSLRDRKAIQLHPYALEDAKYRQAWMERGLKPVYVPKISVAIARDGPSEESQDTDLFQNSQSEESLNQPPMASHLIIEDEESQSPIRAKRQPRPLIQDDLDDELPDLTTILQEKTGMRQPKMSSAPKPRRLPKEPTKFQIFDLPTSDDEQPKVSKNVSRLVQSESFPSPPLSYGRQSPAMSNLSHSDSRYTTPAGPSTPFPTSSHGPTPRAAPNIFDLKESLSDSDSLDEGANSDQSGHNQDEPQRLLKIQRRIRGVLPASWLKLDLAKRADDKIGRQVGTSPINANGDKGVAKHVRMAAKHQKVLPGSRIEDLVTERVPERDTALRRTLDLEVDMLGLVTSDSDSSSIYAFGLQGEEDLVDAMVPKRNRELQSTDRTKRQSRLEYAGSNKIIKDSNVHNNRKRSRPSSHRQNPVEPERRRRQKRLKQINNRSQVSVLDAPSLRGSQRGRQPQFLRIAARKARKKTHKQYHDVSEQNFRLATEQDTNDMLDEIDNWRRGEFENDPINVPVVAEKKGLQPNTHTTTQSAKSKIQHKKSLSETTTFLDSSDELITLQRSTNRLLQVISNRPNRNKVSALPINSLSTESGLPSSGVNRLRALLPRVNRSGNGQFWSKTSTPRAAQLEVPIARLDIQPAIPQEYRRQRRADSAIANTDMQDLATTTVSDLVPRIVLDQRFHSPPQFQLKTPKQARKPRKQLPQKWQRHKMDNSVGFDIAALCPAAVNTLIPGGLLQSGYLISAERLAVAELHVNPLNWESNEGPVVDVITPISSVVVPCEIWNDLAKQQIVKVLSEIMACFIGDSRRKSEKSLESVIRFINKPRTFRSVQDGEEYVGLIMQSMQELIPLLRDTRTEFVIDNINQLLVIAYQAYNINHVLLVLSPADSHHEMQNRVTQIIEQLIYIGMRRIFRPKIAQVALNILERLRVRDPKLQERPARPYIALLEMIVLSFHILKGVFGLSTGQTAFYDLISQSIHQSSQSDTEKHILGLRAVCLTMPLVRFSDAGHALPPEHIDMREHTYIWNLLLPTLPALTSSSQNRYLTYLKTMTVAVCDEIHRWGVQPSEIIVKALWKMYNNNGMHGFHERGEAVRRTVDLLSQLKTQHYLEYSNVRMTESDSDFDLFLAMVRRLLTNKLHDGSTAGRLRSLVVSLIPNSAKVTSKQKALPLPELETISNTFYLIVTLLESVPDTMGPRIRQIETLVDFTDSHNELCRVALKGWYYIARNCLSSSSVAFVQDLSHWMSNMISETLQRIPNARVEIQNVLGESVAQVDQQALQIIESNDKSTHELLLDIMSVYSHALTAYATSWDTFSFLFGNPTSVLDTILKNPECRQEVFQSALSLLNIYFDAVVTFAPLSLTSRSIMEDVLLLLRFVIQDRMGSSIGPVVSRTLNVHFDLIRTWAKLAKAMVSLHVKSWDDFISPLTNISLTMLIAPERLITVRALFISHFVKSEDTSYKLEYRTYVFNLWVTALLQPVHLMEFEYALTEALLVHETESMNIAALKHIFHDDTGQIKVVQSEVLVHRSRIITHLIRTIYGQEGSPEGDYLAGGLDDPDLVGLLRTITNTAKATWSQLRDSDKTREAYEAACRKAGRQRRAHDEHQLSDLEIRSAQDDFLALVHDMLDQLETYTRADFRIDPWFYNANEVPQRVENLADHFRPGQATTNGTRAAFERLCRSATADEIGKLFCPSDLQGVRGVSSDGHWEYSVDLVQQASFVREVFPEYIRRCGSGSDSGRLVLDALVWIVSNIHTRIDNLDACTAVPFFEAVFACVATARGVLLATTPRPSLPDSDALFKLLRVSVLQVEKVGGLAGLEEGGALVAFWDDVGAVVEAALEEEEAAVIEGELRFLVEAVLGG